MEFCKMSESKSKEYSDWLQYANILAFYKITAICKTICYVD